MVRFAVLALILALTGCGSDYFNRPATIPSNAYRRQESMPANQEPGEFNGVPR